MRMTQEPVYFVHITDTHIGPDKDYIRHDSVSYPKAEKLIELINTLPQQPDFVIHTGDVVTDPDPTSYALAADLFARLEVPIYYIVGNHDTAADIRRWLPMGPHEALSERLLSYAFEVKGNRFLAIDSRAPDEMDPLGQILPEQLAIVQHEAQPDGPPLTAFIHHPLWPLDAPWMDANMLVVNASQLHAALLPARERLRGVFHGHVHQAMQTIKEGITYICAASSFAQFGSWPQDVEASFLGDEPPGFNFVTLLPGQTIVRQHRFSMS